MLKAEHIPEHVKEAYPDCWNEKSFPFTLHSRPKKTIDPIREFNLKATDPCLFISAGGGIDGYHFKFFRMKDSLIYTLEYKTFHEYRKNKPDPHHPDPWSQRFIHTLPSYRFLNKHLAHLYLIRPRADLREVVRYSPEWSLYRCGRDVFKTIFTPFLKPQQ